MPLFEDMCTGVVDALSRILAYFKGLLGYGPVPGYEPIQSSPDYSQTATLASADIPPAEASETQPCRQKAPSEPEITVQPHVAPGIQLEDSLKNEALTKPVTDLIREDQFIVSRSDLSDFVSSTDFEMQGLMAKASLDVSKQNLLKLDSSSSDQASASVTADSLGSREITSLEPNKLSEQSLEKGQDLLTFKETEKTKEHSLIEQEHENIQEETIEEPEKAQVQPHLEKEELSSEQESETVQEEFLAEPEKQHLEIQVESEEPSSEQESEATQEAIREEPLKAFLEPQIEKVEVLTEQEFETTQEEKRYLEKDVSSPEQESETMKEESQEKTYLVAQFEKEESSHEQESHEESEETHLLAQLEKEEPSTEQESEITQKEEPQEEQKEPEKAPETPEISKEEPQEEQKETEKAPETPEISKEEPQEEQEIEKAPATPEILKEEPQEEQKEPEVEKTRVEPKISEEVIPQKQEPIKEQVIIKPIILKDTEEISSKKEEESKESEEGDQKVPSSTPISGVSRSKSAKISGLGAKLGNIDLSRAFGGLGPPKDFKSKRPQTLFVGEKKEIQEPEAPKETTESGLLTGLNKTRPKSFMGKKRPPSMRFVKETLHRTQDGFEIDFNGDSQTAQKPTFEENLSVQSVIEPSISNQSDDNGPAEPTPSDMDDQTLTSRDTSGVPSYTTISDSTSFENSTLTSERAKHSEQEDKSTEHSALSGEEFFSAENIIGNVGGVAGVHQD